MRVGLVGCGRLAERGWVPALMAAPGVELVAVADPELERCRRVAPEAPAYRSAEGLVGAGAADALIVATPVAGHLAAARAGAAAGLAVLVEKPPARDAVEAAELAALEPVPFVGFNRRFDDEVAALRSRIPGEGELELALEIRTSRRDWRPYVADDDAWLDTGPHLVDLARWLSGAEVERARAVTLDPRRAVVELALGRARATVTCRGDRPYAERLVARDGRGEVLARWRRGGTVRNQLTRFRPGAPDPLVVSLTAQAAELAAAVRGERAPTLATAADGARVMGAHDAVRRSAAAGGGWERPG